MSKFLTLPRKLLARLGLLSLLVTLALVLVGEVQTAVAWWIMIACLLPALIWVRRSQFLSIKVFVWTTFVTMAVTTPMFYLNPKLYTLQNHRPFDFTGLESLYVFSRVGVFLLVFLFITGILELFLKLPKENSGFTAANVIVPQITTTKSQFSIAQVRPLTSLISSCLIVTVITAMVPLNSWMFDMGIGLTGAAPPELPYRLSGILAYFARLFIPMLLAFLYLRTRRRSLFIVGILGLYSLFLGVSTVSRSTALMIILPALVFALLDRRWILFGASAIFLTLSLAMASFSREVVFTVVGGVSGSNTSLGVINVLLEVAENLEWNRILSIIPAIVGRIESFQSLWLASHVDPTSLGGGWSVLTKVVHWGLIDLGHDAVHLEVLGYTVAEGFYNVSAGVLAYMLWAMGESWFFSVSFALLYALFLMIQERSLQMIANRYAIQSLYISPLLVLLTANYFISPGWPIGNFVLLAVICFSRLPRFGVLAALLARIGVSFVGSRVPSFGSPVSPNPRLRK